MQEPGDESDDDQSAADRVVQLLTDKNEFDRALEALNLIPESAAYPFPAAQRLFEKLPEGDPRRVILFGRAQAAYDRRPQGAFPEFLARHWRAVPPATAQRALQSVLASLGNRGEETARSEMLKTDKDAVQLKSRQTIEYFRLAAALRQLAPNTLQDLLARHPDLRDAVQHFPEGRGSVDWTERASAIQERSSGSSSRNATAFSRDDAPSLSLLFGFAVPGRDIQKLFDQWPAATRKANEALTIAERNPRNGLDVAREISLEGLRAETAAQIASMAAAKNEPAGREAVNAALSIVADLAVPADRVAAWVALAEASHKLRDEKAAWQALENAVSDAGEILRDDANAERPNTAPRAYWPSTQACRMALSRGAKLFGVRAVALLAGISDKDLALLGRIDVAAALAGHELTSMRVLFAQ